jgi:hypothetical protein
MQPLDVGVFQPYKHWQAIALQRALYRLEDNYNLESFLRDLPQIRRQTMTEGTIIHSFAKAGIVPHDSTKVLRLVKKYSPSQEDDLSLPPPLTPHSLTRQGDYLQRKIAPILSSPTRSTFSLWRTKTETLVSLGSVYRNQIVDIQVSHKEKQKARESGIARSWLKTTGAITVGDGLRKSAEKKAEKEAVERKKMENQKKRKRGKPKVEVILDDDSDATVDILGTVDFSSFFDNDGEFNGTDEQAASFAAGPPLPDPWNEEPCPFTSQQDVISLY